MRSNWVRAGAVGVMLLSSVVAVDAFGAPSGAQTSGTGPIVFEGMDSNPAVSDEGTFVVFQSDTADPARPTIVVHDRTQQQPSPTNPALITGSAMGVRPGISGDGCFVAWSVDRVAPAPGLVPPPDDDTEGGGEAAPDDGEPQSDVVPDDDPVPDALQVATPARLVVFDRCTAGRKPVPVAGVAEIERSTRLGAPALALDGSVLAVSTGQEVVILQRGANGVYTPRAATDGTSAPVPTRLTDDHVDVSDDGSVVVFSSGPEETPATRDVMKFQAGATAGLLPGAKHPDISGDGSILVAEQGGQVVVTPLPVAALKALGTGTKPVISGDGNHVVFDTANGVAIRSWTGADATPFAQVNGRNISGVGQKTASGPAIDRYGTLVATDVPGSNPPADTNISVTTIVADASFGSATYDLGVGKIGDRLDATLDITNDGPASFVIDTITVDGAFVIEPGTCGGMLRPGTTCTFDVSYTVEELGDAVADVTVTGLLPGSGSFTAEVEALGQAPATTTTTSTTAPSGGSTGGTTTGGSSGGDSTGGTSGTTGGTSSTSGGTSSTTTGRPTSTTTGRPTSTTTGRPTTGRPTTTTTTTTTLPAGSGVVISPASFAFAPTIIDSGRRTGAVEVVNSASAAASIDIVTLRGDPSFAIAADGCSGVVLGEGERCTITVDFAPTAAVDVNAELAVLVAGGRELTATLDGVGARAPQLSVFPETARAGQVVTVRGDGFPTGLLVELVSGLSTDVVEVDAAGSFAHPVVIMPNTSTGPFDVVVLGQDDQFGDVTTSMVVRATDDRSVVPILDGVGVNVGR